MVSTEEDRLRRELRAMAVVNRQLQAQLEEPQSMVKQRRATSRNEWIELLAAAGINEPQLVRSPDGKTFVVEGDVRRPVRSGILAAALEEMLHPARAVTEAELNRWSEGVPVEVLEAPNGPPFVVVGGRRHPVRGLPLPHPVTNKDASEFPEGEELNVAAANISRTRYRQVMSPEFQLDRIKGAVKRKGVLGAAKTAVKRVQRRLR